MITKFICFISLLFLSGITFAIEPICSQQMNQALRTQAVNTTVVKNQEVNSEEYKKKRELLYNEFKLMAHSEKDNGLTSDARNLATKLAFRQFVGESFVTADEYEVLKKNGYYDPENKNQNKEETFKEKIGNFFNKILTLAKNTLNSVKGAVTGKYSPPPQFEKLSKELGEFRTKYGIHEDDGFDILINNNTTFDTIVSGENEVFRSFLEKNQVKAYEIRKDLNHPILVEYNDDCRIKKIVFIEKASGPDWSSDMYSYYTTSYCSDIGQIDKIKDNLPPESDPKEYHFRCKEQGADDNCWCEKKRIYINPWGLSCFEVRKKPTETASDKFEKYSHDHGALPGVFFSKSTFNKSKERCQTVRKLASAASDAKVESAHAK